VESDTLAMLAPLGRGSYIGSAQVPKMRVRIAAAIER
jgi:hypothetical protein